jgi:NAD(P)-dependent dehydrogenase (short-subunit alcohol dehydrogenase family)
MKIWINGGSRGLGLDLAEKINKDSNQITVLTAFPESCSKIESIKLVKKSNDIIKFKNQILHEIDEDNFPDVILHTSGGGYGKTTYTPSAEDFNEVFLKNFQEILFINKIILESKPQNHELKIIHFGSVAAKESIGNLSYNVSKSSLNTYVRSLGNHLCAEKVVICGINLGAYYSKNGAMGRLKESKPEIFEKIINESLPWHKMMTISEILPIIQFLIEEDIYYFSGCMIPMDGGQGTAYEV